MKFLELDLIEVEVCKDNNIKESMNISTRYFPLSNKVEHIEGVTENKFFKEEEMSKILTALMYKESVLDEEYIDDIEELCTQKIENYYVFTLYYILEDVDFALIRTIKVFEPEVLKALKKN